MHASSTNRTSLSSLHAIINFSPLIVVAGTQVSDVIALMNQHQQQGCCVLIVGENLQLLGCFTERELVRLLVSGADLHQTKIAEVMETSVTTLDITRLEDLASTISIFYQNHLSVLPVVNGQNQVLGLITYRSISEAVANHSIVITATRLGMGADEQTKTVKQINPQLANGTQVWLETNKIPLHDPKGNVLGILLTLEDITKRKQAEEALRLYERAIAASSNGIVISDVTLPDAPIIYANPAFERITGYSVAEVIGKNCRFLQGGDTDQLGLTQLRTAIAQETGCTVILRNYRKNGTLFWNELTISPVYDSNGRLTNYIGIQTDITERKQAEVSLLISQEQLKHLLFSNPGVIYTCKYFGNYATTFMSENVVTMLGYESREFTDDPNFWAAHVHPDDIKPMLAALPKLLEQKQFGYEYRFLHKDGSYRWMYDQAKLIQDETGNPVEVVGYWVDITQRKQLEEDLRSALHKEKELNELKSRFVSMTSHEFRTPLSTILSSSELLEYYRHKWSEEKQLSHLRRIQTAVKHMTQMLADVLVIGKAEAGKLDLRPTSLDLVEYCRYMVEEFQLNIHNQHTITFTSQFESLPCYMDEKILGHILSNLLSNAVKYSPINTNIQLTLKSHGESAVFEIQDQGIGIPSEDLPRLFESFYRATNVGHIPGTGLGLAIVKKCIDICGGHITVKSEVGLGTKFIIHLPLNYQI